MKLRFQRRSGPTSGPGRRKRPDHAAPATILLHCPEPCHAGCFSSCRDERDEMRAEEFRLFSFISGRERSGQLARQKHRSIIVIAAVRADTMGHFGLMAMAALGSFGRLQLPVGTSFIAACPGVTSFGIWHKNLASVDQFLQHLPARVDRPHAAQAGFCIQVHPAMWAKPLAGFRAENF